MAIDIEASITGSRLGIGVFGSQQQLSHDQALLLVSSIAGVLNEITGWLIALHKRVGGVGCFNGQRLDR